MIDKVSTLAAAVDLIQDGDVVAIQAGPTQCTPMAMVREIIRAGRTDLHAVFLSGSIALDWLAAARSITRCTFAAVTMEHFGLCQQFRRQVQAGEIEVEELSELAMIARLDAGARGLPFLPIRGMIGTDLLNVGNEALRVIDDPFGGPPVVACAALRPDVAILHAHRADRHGNVAVDAVPRYPTMTSMPRASRRVIVTVEEIVETDELRRAPDRTILPGFAVDAVVEVPHGAHPTSLFPAYDYDAAFFSAWAEASTSDSAAQEFLDRYVREPDYVGTIGASRLSALTIAHAPEAR